MDQFDVARVIKRSNFAMWLGLAIVVAFALLAENKLYAVIAILMLIYFRLQTIYNNMLLVSDWIDRFKPELRRPLDV